jgi:hypothetical protein
MAFTGNALCNVFKTGLLDGSYDFGTGTTDVFKIALYTNSATLDADTTAYSATGEVADAGYTAGGETLTISQVPTIGTQTGSSAVTYLSFSNVSWSGAITARGALVYKYNGTTNPAVFVLDFGSDKTSTTTFTVEFPTASSTSAILRLA